MQSLIAVFFVFAGIFLSSSVVAQDSLSRSTLPYTAPTVAVQKKRPLDIAISPGVAYQEGQFLGELNVLAGRYESSMCGGNSFAGVRIGAETNFARGNEFLFAPKVGVEASGLIFCFRATALTYISGRHAQLRFLPEIGISVFCFANLTYGYSFALTQSDFIDLPGHRFTLSFNLNGDLPADL
jgi:hypothetical protein